MFQGIVLDNRIKKRRLFGVTACKRRLIWGVIEMIVTSTLKFFY